MRRRRLVVALGCGLAAATMGAAPVGPPSRQTPHGALTLWYRQPAREWVQALPIGNGRMGAMVFGGTVRENIQLNEDTVWSGGGAAPPALPPGVAGRLPEIRQLLFDGRFAEGEALARQTLLAVRNGGNASYQTLGDLWLDAAPLQAVTGYERSLDLDTGVAVTTFTSGGVTYRREVFASAPDHVIVVRLSADRPGQVTTRISLTRQNAVSRADGTGTLVMASAEGAGPAEGVKFAAVVKIAAEHGSLSPDAAQIVVTGSDAVTLTIAAATNYNRRNPYAPLEKDLRAEAAAAAAAAGRLPYATIRSRAIGDHQRLFRRVDLQLAAGPVPDRPIDERLEAVRAGADDPHLLELYFQFGRYLLIGSSRPGGMPANLQGLWNKEMSAPWSADYHININIQMNYWPAEVTNLSELTAPLFDFAEALAEVSGRRIARDFYGTRGSVGHYTTDAWLVTPDTGTPQYALWQMGGAWLTRHFMEHYWFTGDREFLQARAYPMLRDASLFLLDWLVRDPATGKLISGPSASPENRFIAADGGTYATSMGASMDQEIAWDTFNNFLAASRELRVNDDVVERVTSAVAALAWPGIGADGRLMEWRQEFKEAEPGHRHMSHLFGLHPGYQFTQATTPEYVAAARKSLEARLANGGGHTGWSRAWIISFWARLREPERALENAQALLARSTLDNLFDNHPPFQIDGNFGGTAGIAEMLLQSHDGGLTVLPALPKAWASGHFTGLRARGGFDVSASWTGGEIDTIRITSLLGNPCRIRAGSAVREFATTKGRTYVLRGAALR